MSQILKCWLFFKKKKEVRKIKNWGCGLSHIPRIRNYVSVELLNELLTVAGNHDALVRLVNNLTSSVVEHLLCWSFVANLFDT